jgi:ABC-2 type transport system ATP-binding protein
MAAILEVESLTKHYGDLVAVDGVSLTVPEGEVFGLLGPNGAGKTTLISMLTGVLTPTSGTARIGGYDLGSQLRQAKRLNGLVPQDLALYPTLSARANLSFFGRIYGLRGAQLRQRVDEVLDIVALRERADEPIERFSGGMKRRINIAAGLVHQPRLLFLDEPTVGVDPQSRNHIFESVRQLNRERGMTIVYTSHYMEEVEALCHRAAIIDQGRIIALDTIRNLIGQIGGGVVQVGLPAAADWYDALAAEVAELPGVQEASLVAAAEEAPEEGQAEDAFAPSAGSMLRIITRQSQEALVGVIGLLNQRDVTLTSLEILEPNLESVFLHLTGKKLRE